MKRIIWQETRDVQGRRVVAAHVEGEHKTVTAQTAFAAQLYAAKVHYGIRRPVTRFRQYGGVK